MNNNKIKNHSNDSLFFTRSNLDNTKVDNIVSDALHKADDGELFMEFCESESFVFDDQRLKSASFDTCLLYTSPSPRDRTRSRMPSSA